jgi:4,5-dihydroxyphthalate decarboxylase
MSPLRLSLACGRNDRTAGLLSGLVRADGIDLICLDIEPVQLFARQLHNKEFDVAEMSLSAYIALKSRATDDFAALPIFTSRLFRHSYIFVNTASGVSTPADLHGSVIGVPEYHMTAALFIRGMLSDEYSVHASDVSWVQGGQENPGRQERISLDLPSTISMRHEPDVSLDKLLVEGDIDALITATAPPAWHAGDPRVKRLFDDPVRAASEWYRKTHIYPIMHVIVVRDSILSTHPWVAQSLFDAFTASKKMALAALAADGVSSVALPFTDMHVEEAHRLLGRDLWPYGIAANVPTLEAAARYSFEQGISSARMGIGDLFQHPVEEAGWLV